MLGRFVCHCEVFDGVVELCGEVVIDWFDGSDVFGWDIEDMVCAAIKTDLGAKKGSVTCTTRHWQGHTCPEFKGIFDGVKIAIYGDISEFDLEVDPMNYEMYFTYTFIEKN